MIVTLPLPGLLLSFFSRQFFDYSWIGVFVTLQAGPLTWLLVESFDYHVLIATYLVSGECWLLRWYMMRWFGVVR